MGDRKEISLQELDDIQHGKSKSNVTMDMIQVKGIATIFDKDGKVKSTMKIVSLDSQELEENANS
jgi:hypothetical protein